MFEKQEQLVILVAIIIIIFWLHVCWSNIRTDCFTTSTVYELYYANWCPHCVRFKREKWNDVLSHMKRQAANIVIKENITEFSIGNVVVRDINCTSPDKRCGDVAGYPTVKKIINGISIEYDKNKAADEIMLL
jgi:thiol-disulfide isomerase/thioredoxin